MCCNFLLFTSIFANMAFQMFMIYNLDTTLENWQISAIGQNLLLILLGLINCQSILKYTCCNTQKIILMKDDRVNV